MRSKSIRQADLTSECWLIQFWGLSACENCEALNTDECGGLEIRKALLTEEQCGPVSIDGLPDVSDAVIALEARLEDLEAGAYDPANYSQAAKLADQAAELFNDVLDHFDLVYFNPGEPCACPAAYDGPGCGPNAIPLSNGGDGLRTCEEEQLELETGEPSIPSDLYWARLRLAQARDILDDGWQYGLEVE